MSKLSCFLLLASMLIACGPPRKQQQPVDLPLSLNILNVPDGLQIKYGSQDVLTQVAKADFRPFLHPIMAPDGKGELTQYSPGHHKHQTGLYWGFTRVNGAAVEPQSLMKFFYSRDKTPEQQALVGRDFFHHPEGEYWKRLDLNIIQAHGEEVSWETSYHMLDAMGKPMIQEHQTWSLEMKEGHMVLDLTWEAKALRDIRIGAFDYGGLFLRMPWHKGIAGEAINSEGQSNQEAEGQRAKWVDVGMAIEGREDWGHIAMMDHPKNANYPTGWRVDGQLGVGPCRAIHGDWEIAEGNTEKIQLRLMVYTGEIARDLLDQMAKEMGD